MGWINSVVLLLVIVSIASAAPKVPDAPQTTHPDFLATLWASGFDHSGPNRGGYPIGLAGHPDGSMYIVNYDTGTLSKFSTATGGTEADNAIGVLNLQHPTGMKFSPSGRLYVASQDLGLITEHHYTAPNIGALISTCILGVGQATDLQFDPLSGDIFVSTLTSGNKVYRVSSMQHTRFSQLIVFQISMDLTVWPIALLHHTVRV